MAPPAMGNARTRLFLCCCLLAFHWSRYRRLLIFNISMTSKRLHSPPRRPAFLPEMARSYGRLMLFTASRHDERYNIMSRLMPELCRAHRPPVICRLPSAFRSRFMLDYRGLGISAMPLRRSPTTWSRKAPSQRCTMTAGAAAEKAAGRWVSSKMGQAIYASARKHSFT